MSLVSRLTQKSVKPLLIGVGVIGICVTFGGIYGCSADMQDTQAIENAVPEILRIKSIQNRQTQLEQYTKRFGYNLLVNEELNRLNVEYSNLTNNTGVASARQTYQKKEKEVRNDLNDLFGGLLITAAGFLSAMAYGRKR